MLITFAGTLGTRSAKPRLTCVMTTYIEFGKLFSAPTQSPLLAGEFKFVVVVVVVDD